VPAWIAEASCPDSPWSIHRPVEEFDPAPLQFFADGIYVVYAERELRAHAAIRWCDRRRFDEARRLACSQQVNESFAESEHGRVLVFVDHGNPKDLFVEAPRRRQVLFEQRDGGHPPGHPFASFLRRLVHLRPFLRGLDRSWETLATVTGSSLRDPRQVTFSNAGPVQRRAVV
jgi:hypothetical protein